MQCAKRQCLGATNGTDNADFLDGDIAAAEDIEKNEEITFRQNWRRHQTSKIVAAERPCFLQGTWLHAPAGQSIIRTKRETGTADCTVF